MTDMRLGQKENVRPGDIAVAAIPLGLSGKMAGALAPPGADEAPTSTSSLTPVPVVVVHPQALMRSAWRQLLDSQADFSVVAEVSEMAGFAEATTALDTGQQPLVVLVDLDSGNGPDMSRIAKLRSTAPLARLIAVTQHEHDACVMQALRLGVQGFVAKGTSADRLFEAVRVVSSGASFIEVGEQPAPLSVLDPEPGDLEHPRPELSKREQAVLILVAQGKTNDAVGKEMFISASTVKYHLNNIFQKLEANNRTDAVRIALRLGLVSEDPTEFM